MANKKLYRSCESRVLGGVCGGLGEYFVVDPVLIRLLFVIALFGGGLGLLVYIIAWLVLPNDPKCDNRDAKEEMTRVAQDIADTVKKEVHSRRNDNRAIVGVAILVAGVLLLLRNITGIHFWNNFWPIILIVLGLFVIFRGINKGDK